MLDGINSMWENCHKNEWPRWQKELVSNKDIKTESRFEYVGMNCSLLGCHMVEYRLLEIVQIHRFFIQNYHKNSMIFEDNDKTWWPNIICLALLWYNKLNRYVERFLIEAFLLLKEVEKDHSKYWSKIAWKSRIILSGIL